MRYHIEKNTVQETLVIAHRMRTVEAADKIVVLSDGTVAEEGRPSFLFRCFCFRRSSLGG